MYRDKLQENNMLTTEVGQLNVIFKFSVNCLYIQPCALFYFQLSLSELNLIKEMSKTSIPLQLARRLVRQKQVLS
jgi:hypothetical protein